MASTLSHSLPSLQQFKHWKACWFCILLFYNSNHVIKKVIQSREKGKAHGDGEYYMWLVPLSALFLRAWASDRNAIYDIRGSGSSLAAPIWRIWGIEFSLRRRGQTSVNYESSSSGRGKQDITTLNDANTSFIADFVGSDSLLTSNQYSAFPDLQQLPVLLATVAIIYNIPTVGSGQLVLDVGTVASLFSGKITDWSDPRIVALNPGLNLPKLAIIPVVRSGSSGTTEILTRFLAQDSANWKYDICFTISYYNKSATPSASYLYISIYRTISEVLATKGGVGYAAFPFAVQTHCKYAQLRAADGQLTLPEPPTTYTGKLELNETSFALQLTISPGAYPITDTSYMIFHKYNPYKDCDFQREYLRFLRFVLLDASAHSLAQYQGYIVIPSGDVLDKILKELDQVVCPETGAAILEIQYSMDKKLTWDWPRLVLASMAVFYMALIVLLIYQLTIVLATVDEILHRFAKQQHNPSGHVHPILYRFANTNTMRLAGIAFAVSFLCGCFFAYLSVFFWNMPPLEDSVCQLRYASALLGISTLMAVMVTKTHLVWIILKVSDRSLADVKAISNWNFLRTMTTLLFPQVAIVLIWFLIMPPSSTTVLLDPITRQYRHICLGNTGLFASVAESVYLTCLTVAGTYYAFKTKGFWKKFDLPNESSNIYHALEKIFICLIFFVPIVLAIEPDTTLYVTVVSVAILVPTTFSCYRVMGNKFAMLFQSLSDSDSDSDNAKRQASLRTTRSGSRPSNVRNSLHILTDNTPSRQNSLEPPGSPSVPSDNNKRRRQQPETLRTTTASVKSEDSNGKVAELSPVSFPPSLQIPDHSPSKEKSRSLQVFPPYSNDSEKHVHDTLSPHPQASPSFTETSFHEIAPPPPTPINSQSPDTATPLESGPPVMNSNMNIRTSSKLERERESHLDDGPVSLNVFPQASMSMIAQPSMSSLDNPHGDSLSDSHDSLNDSHDDVDDSDRRTANRLVSVEASPQRPQQHLQQATSVQHTNNNTIDWLQEPSQPSTSTQGNEAHAIVMYTSAEVQARRMRSAMETLTLAPHTRIESLISDSQRGNTRARDESDSNFEVA
eukprot:g41262.t1